MAKTVRKESSGSRKLSKPIVAFTSGCRCPSLILDNGDRVTFVNNAFSELIGIPEERLLGIHITDIFSVNASEWESIKRSGVGTITTLTKKTRLRLINDYEDGTNILILDYQSPLSSFHGEDGSPLLVEGIIKEIPSDIAKRPLESKKAEGFSSVVYNTPVPICVIQEGRIVYANEAMISKFGNAESDVIGRSFFDFIHSEDVGAVKERYSIRISGGDADSNYSVRMQGKDGTFHARIRAELIDWYEEPAVVVIAEDVSIYVRTERILRESESQKREILNSFPTPIILKDKDGLIVWANKSARETFGIEEKDKSLNDLLDPDVSYDLQEVCIEADSNNPSKIKYLRMRNGRVYESDGFSIQGDESLGRTVLVFRDISEELKANLDAKGAKDRLAIASAAIGFSTFTYNYGDDFFTVESMPDEMIAADEKGRVPLLTFEKIVHPDDFDDILSIIENDHTGEGLIERTFRARFLREDYKWYRLLAKKIVDGDETYITGAVFNNDEIIRSREALRQANKKLTFLSAIVGHDIINRVTVALGYTELLRDRCPPELSEEKGMITHLNTSLQNIKEQVDFIRYYQEMGTNAPCWIRISEELKALRQDRMFENLEIIDESNGIELYADPLFSKVLYNLADNSLRHGGDLCKIRVYSPEYGTLVVEDDGKGIPSDMKERIFDKDVGNNTGLGLFLVREILSITDISIEETGEPGKGARFVMHVPYNCFRVASYEEKPPL